MVQAITGGQSCLLLSRFVQVKSWLKEMWRWIFHKGTNRCVHSSYHRLEGKEAVFDVPATPPVSQ